MGSSSCGIGCNVTITCKDLKGKTLYKVEKHNKVTKNFTDGILRFLKGDFTETEFNSTPIPSEAQIYTPTRVKFGVQGIKLEKTIIEEHGEDYVVKSFTPPDPSAFNNEELNQEIPFDDDPYIDLFPIIKFERMKQTYNTSVSDTERLSLSLYIGPGKTVGATVSSEDGEVEEFKPYKHSYWSEYFGCYCATFSEVGLYSSTGTLLARVALDGDWMIVDAEGEEASEGTLIPREDSTDSVVYQNQFCTMTIEWRIDLTSIGSQDNVITENRT